MACNKAVNKLNIYSQNASSYWMALKTYYPVMSHAVLCVRKSSILPIELIIKPLSSTMYYMSKDIVLCIRALLSVLRISDAGVRSLVDSACGPKLQELNLTNCVRVGDMSLVSIHKR